jgi:hypothetical protein
MNWFTRRTVLRLLAIGGFLLGCVLLFIGVRVAYAPDPEAGWVPGPILAGAMIVFVQSIFCYWMSCRSQET